MKNKTGNVDLVFGLLGQRLDDYEESTEAILAAMSGVIDGIKLHAMEEDLLNDNIELTIMMVSAETDGYITMVGALKPLIGTTVMAPSGEQFIVETEDDRLEYAKVIHINLSLDVIEANSAEYTVTYIRESTKEFDESLSDLLEHTATYVTGDMNVDLNALTEDQKLDDEILEKILEGATNPSGMFN